MFGDQVYHTVLLMGLAELSIVLYNVTGMGLGPANHPFNEQLKEFSLRHAPSLSLPPSLSFR